jgi:hypothetical protein
MSETIIVAPHPDDELIGCYEILKKSDPPIIIYGGNTQPNRREEIKNIQKFFTIKVQLFQNSIPTHLINPDNTFYFPNHVDEMHPEHRAWGFQGESLARQGMNVIFYTTEMNVPYKHLVEDPKDKKMYLESCYPSQADLWKYEYKYFLFEGYMKWIF